MPESLFLIKLQVSASACDFIKKEILEQVYSFEFCEISKDIFFTEHLRWLLLSFECQTFNAWCPLKGYTDLCKSAVSILRHLHLLTIFHFETGSIHDFFFEWLCTLGTFTVCVILDLTPCYVIILFLLPLREKCPNTGEYEPENRRIRTRNNSIFGHFSSCVRYSEYSSMFKFQNQAGLTKSSKWFIVIYHSTCVWWLISTKIKSTLVKLKELTNFANRQELTFYLIHTMDFV